jgi:hypothetical protein
MHESAKIQMERNPPKLGRVFRVAAGRLDRMAAAPLRSHCGNDTDTERHRWRAMTLFPRTRASIRRIAWRLGFTGRVMEKTLLSRKEAYAMAVQVQEIFPDQWEKWHPSDTADSRINLLVPANRFRKGRC